VTFWSTTKQKNLACGAILLSIFTLRKGGGKWSLLQAFWWYYSCAFYENYTLQSHVKLATSLTACSDPNVRLSLTTYITWRCWSLFGPHYLLHAWTVSIYLSLLDLSTFCFSSQEYNLVPKSALVRFWVFLFGNDKPRQSSTFLILISRFCDLHGNLPLSFFLEPTKSHMGLILSL